MTRKIRELDRIYERNWRNKNRDKYRLQKREYQRQKWQADPELAKRKQREYRAKVREKVLIAYGSKCACCGESDLHFLTFDHINGGGMKERRLTGMTGSTFYLSLLKNHRADIRVLCFNCNCARYFYGKCPHKD